MVIGVPKEIKTDEYRVAMTPSGVEVLVQHGHRVLIERGAGEGTGISDSEYEAAGACVVDNAADVWRQADMIVKVKEPLPSEYPLIRPNQVVFTFFHFAASEELTRAMVNSGAICIAYETIQTPDGAHPVLLPMSEIAGRMAVQVGAWCLERPMGGRGVLLAGAPGVLPGTVVVIGAGVVGANAARVAAGIGARVIILDVNIARLRALEETLPANVDTLYSNPANLREAIRQADLIVGAVYVTGGRTPILIKREMLSMLKQGAVLVDVSVDQGGLAETIRPTTHREPTYIVDGIVHYAVSNMPGAVARTSTYALTNATMPYVLRLAERGWQEACREDSALRHGLNIVQGKVTLQPIAEQFGYEYVPPEAVL
ncbi:MAG: alanine dehydrogenase [Armatimonadota bacterium]|nr:alanine dehydrogenase [Armatimonadota bacterium]